MELVRQHKVLDDPMKLLRTIQEKETAEGFEMKMDKKSLLRTLLKLTEEGQIKNIIIKLELKNRKRTLHFICDPSIDENHSLIRSAVEQVKMKLNILPILKKKQIVA